MNTQITKNTQDRIEVVPVKTVRTVKSPSDENVVTYYAWVEFKDLPKNISLEVNPRKPKMTTSVAKQLITAVQDTDSNFDINNRGIVIRAKNFKFNTNNSTAELNLGDNDKKYGILDGGHTYTAIIQNGQNLPQDMKKYVKLEIFVGETLDVSALADARNTSAQVSDIALFELDDKFDFIKQAIVNEPYSEDVAYKDNDNKRIQIVELLKLMYAFNIKRYPNDSSAPVSAYSGKANVFKDYKKEFSEEDNIYFKLANELPTLVALYEKIQLDLPNKYIEYKNQDGKTGRFGALRGVESEGNFQTSFTKTPLSHGISIGYILPIFGAFRALLKLNENQELTWRFNPLEVWETASVRLIQNTFETDKNPQLAGKNKILWQSNYRIVDSIQKDLLLEMYMK